MTSAPIPAPTAPILVAITSLDQEGRGLARIDGKAVFVEGGLPREEVTITMLKRKPTYDIARAETIVKPSAARVLPRCPHFGVCGGCTLQHLDASAQVAAKQRTLEDTLWHVGRVRAAQILPAIHGPAWSYRHRARLSVRYVPKKGGVLVGFHERKSSFVADMTSCSVLPPKISALLPELRTLVAALTIRDRLPQIELAVGDGALTTDAGTAAMPTHALVLRILAPLAPADEARLRAFADLHGVQFYLQPEGPDTVTPFHPTVERLA
ncbi:MAG: TRAM domain-containing protein, partial [Burkholderiaceae bacterium]